MNPCADCLASERSILIVVDVQDRLLAKIPQAELLIKNIAFLIDMAQLFDVPIRATEQYPQGLGPTNPVLACRLPQPPLAKTAFSCCGAGTFLEELQMLRRPQVVVTGIETHVCISQTAFDLLRAGLHVYLPVDALGARSSLDHEMACRRLERAGGVLTTVEAIAFEWLKDATHPRFQQFRQLVIARTSS
jgi:nicotinamidase-related amidase